MKVCSAPGLIVPGPELSIILAAIAGIGARPMLVGGCVRDAILGVPCNDIDLEVYGRPLDDLAVALDQIPGAHVDLVGQSFGVVKVRLGGEEFDVAVPRQDSKTGDGHRGFDVHVDHNLSFTDASARRDFTINAMMFDLHAGQLIDPHAGLADLDAQVLRHTSDAFSEDPLRVLRAAQLAGRFDLTLAPETVALCRGLAPSFSELAVERVQGEWSKIATKAEVPSRSLDVLCDTGWQTHFPQIDQLDGIPQDSRWHPEGDVEVHVRQVVDAAAKIAGRDGLSGRDREVLFYGALAHDFGKVTTTVVHADGRVTAQGHAEEGVAPARAFLASIGCSTEVADLVVPLVAEHMCCASVGVEGPSASAVRRLARRLGPASIEQWARVVEADHAGRGTASGRSPAGSWVALARSLNVQDGPVAPLVGGRDLIARGHEPGPMFKTILRAAQAAQDIGEFTDNVSGQEWLDRYLSIRLSEM